MKIPFVNLPIQHSDMIDEIHEAIDKVLVEQPYILGPSVEAFEKAMAHHMGVPHAVGVNSGTDALLISLKALNIGPGDEVIVPVFTFVAVADVVVRAGAKPIFVDVDPLNYNMAIDSVAQAITAKTKAIIAVHMFGQACDLVQLLQLANAHGIFLIEDVSQACGGRIGNQYLGTMGVTGCFSFYPTKNLGGIGDGGMILTHNDDLVERMRRYRDHGRAGDGHFAEIGFNSRLDPIQAAILRLKLAELDEGICDRIENARLYNQLLEEADIMLPEFCERGEHAYNYYTIQLDGRDELRKYLAEREIGTAIYYSTPLHLEPCFAYLGYKEGDFPVAEMICNRVISLPVFPGLKMKEVEAVAFGIHEYLAIRDAAKQE